MAHVPTLQDIPPLPTDKRQGIGASVQYALKFATSMTDIVIHEGQVIRAKSARGTRPLHELLPAAPSFVVTREHLVHYLAGRVGDAVRSHDGTHAMERPPSAQDDWDRNIRPLLARRQPVNFRLDGEGGHTLRCSLFLQRGGELALVMRILTPGIRALADLPLPPAILTTLTEASSGFLLITGPTGAGKSDTALSLLDWHNTRHAGHLLTIEDPIEKTLAPRRAIVTQREVGFDVASSADALREAARTSVDVLLVSEIRDADTAEQAIQIGESGALAVATTQGKSVTGALRKILGFTGPRADALRLVLAGTLVAVVRQALVPMGDGERYALAADVLFNTGSVPRLIERGDWSALDEAIHADGRLGAHEWLSMNDRLVELVRRGEVDAAEAMRETSDIPSLRRKLAGIVSLPGMR